MFRTMALSAFLSAVAGPMAFADARPKGTDSQAAYTVLLKDLARFRIEQQNCVGDETSGVREFTELVLGWSEQFSIMPRSKAIDMVNDEQILERIATNRTCRDFGARREQVMASSDRFLAIRSQQITP